MAENHNAERLFEVGFRSLGRWVINEDSGLMYQLQLNDDDARTRLKSGAALYAFVSDGAVLYVGKTSMTLAERFAGYRRPGNGQSTNIKCNNAIVQLLARGKGVEILSLSGITPLRWGGFELNIAAGLEDSLIAELTPAWNGRAGRATTESELNEREALEDTLSIPMSHAPVDIAEAKGTFTIELRDTYYHQGIINPGINVSGLIGAHGEEVWLRLGADDQRGVQTPINRRANNNGSPRFYGGKQVTAWFQNHFKMGDTVRAAIISPHEVVLELP